MRQLHMRCSLVLRTALYHPCGVRVQLHRKGMGGLCENFCQICFIVCKVALRNGVRARKKVACQRVLYVCGTG